MEDNNKKKVGMYAWGGPGTIELLREKYHNPKIDEDSFYYIYSDDFLRQAKEKFGLTDLWITYSWGFAEDREYPHYQYARQVLKNIKQYGFNTYGYVQGFNAVTADFKNKDIFCESPAGHKLPYSRNRHLICVNKPSGAELLKRRVKLATNEYFDNIYMDNIMFGLPPFYLSKKRISSFGCHCGDCRDKFKQQFGYDLPTSALLDNKKIIDAIKFRCDSVKDIVSQLSAIARSRGKGFGVNLYDPFFHVPEIYFGYSLQDIDDYLDYYLIENHAIGIDESYIDNSHLRNIINKSNKPFFVLSYKKGIGVEEKYSQKIVDLIFTESKKLGYSVCLKTSEYTTGNIWHTLPIDELRAPVDIENPIKENLSKKEHLQNKLLGDMATRIINYQVARLLNFIYHNRFIFWFLKKSGLYTKKIRKSQYFNYKKFYDYPTNL